MAGGGAGKNRKNRRNKNKVVNGPLYLKASARSKYIYYSLKNTAARRDMFGFERK
jgi:hypothetical protein